MRKRRDPVRLTFTTIVPDLTPDERARRIERCIDTLARVTGIEGYKGCKYFPEKERGEIYISE